MRLGARIFKTGLAITLALYGAIWFGLEPAFFAGLTAAFAIQPSVYRTFQTIIEQVQANLIGAILAVIFGLAFGHEPFVIGVVVMIAIAIILKMNLEASTIPITLVTIIIIMGNPADGYVMYALSRFALIMIGVFSAFVINLFFLPPKYETRLYNQILEVTENAARWIRLTTRHETNTSSRREDIESTQEQLVQMDQLYLLYKEERNYFSNKKYAKARKLVIFREMLAVTNQMVTILRMLDHRENDYRHLPESMQRLIQQQLDHLSNYHERILLRYSGKVNAQTTEWVEEERDEGNESLMTHFMDSYDNQEVSREEWLNMLPFVSHIIDYHNALEHLDLLVESYFNYHKSDEKSALD